METQIGKNHREERRNSLVCRGYSELVKLSNVYNLSSSIDLDRIAFSSNSLHINTLRVVDTLERQISR